MKIVFSDDDADGVISAYMISSYLSSIGERHKVIFQTWDKFGLTEKDVEQILSYQPSQVYVLDIGSGIDVLQRIKPLMEKKITVTILDNHPPELEVLGEKEYMKFLTFLEELKKTGYLEYFSSTENCTTGYCYLYIQSHGMKVTEFLEKLTILGLVADVSTDKKIGGEIYGKLLSKYPEYAGTIYYGANATFKWSIIDAIVQFFHVPRRIIYDEASPLLMEFLRDIEHKGYDFITLYGEIEGELGKLYKSEDKKIVNVLPSYPPSVQKIAGLLLSWRTEWKKVLDRGNIFTLDYETFQISIIKHKWNLGSAICNLRLSETRKPQFVINIIPEKNIVYVSARSDGKIHVGKVFSQCDKSILDGGGIREAGSALARTYNISAIVREIVKNTKSQS